MAQDRQTDERASSTNAPVVNKASVDDYTEAILLWWRTNGASFPAWALAARVIFAISPNSASCERVFALLKHLFGEEQYSSLADILEASLMLNYHGWPHGGVSIMDMS